MNKAEKKMLKKIAKKKRNNPLWQLNPQFKQLRMRFRLSIEEFASILRIKPDLIESMETDEYCWNYQNALRIAHNFGKTFKIEIVDKK